MSHPRRCSWLPQMDGMKIHGHRLVCLFVGLVYVLMSRVGLVWKFVPLYIAVSKKWTSSEEQLPVNFIVGWASLHLCRKA